MKLEYEIFYRLETYSLSEKESRINLISYHDKMGLDRDYTNKCYQVYVKVVFLTKKLIQGLNERNNFLRSTLNPDTRIKNSFYLENEFYLEVTKVTNILTWSTLHICIFRISSFVLSGY